MKNRMNWMTAAFLAPLAALPAAGEMEQKPNIVVILADDLRADCIGAVNPRIHTPNIDRLAKEGVLFNNAYFMGGNFPAVCLPSRTMLMSGRTLFHLPKDIQASGNTPLVPVMSTVFRQAGYDSLYCGKNGGSSYQPGNNSFDKTVSINVRTRGRTPGKLLDVEVIETETAKCRAYAPQVVSWLAEPVRKNKPFFVFYAPSIPHDPLYPEPEDMARYAGDKRPLLPPNAAVDHKAVAGFNLRDTNIRPYEVPGMGIFRTPLDLEQWRDVLALYYAYTTTLDRHVGQIIAELERTGAFKNTIIIFTSDNGHSFSDQGLIHKESVYEQDVRVPLIVCGPGVLSGKRSDAFVYISDIFPTLCQQIGIPVPATVETKSFLPTLTAPGKPHRSTLYHAYREEMRAYRDDQYKIILFNNQRVRLFDLKADPYEMKDLSKEQPERVATMIAAAREAGKTLGEDQNAMGFWQLFDGKRP